ncbi:hypothetical protein PR048_008387 [Dryococelus australis]|uniref:Uncharacterized protein n=1 Tax=Dryococelus australis TaxID=614101 RepID=A0ABQ9HYM9_9NEOP|nr:hypothetical protein PR048_008387 [Dryococelus australis]
MVQCRLGTSARARLRLSALARSHIPTCSSNYDLWHKTYEGPNCLWGEGGARKGNSPSNVKKIGRKMRLPGRIQPMKRGMGNCPPPSPTKQGFCHRPKCSHTFPCGLTIICPYWLRHKRVNKVKYGTHHNTTKWKTYPRCPTNSSQLVRGAGTLADRGRVSKRKDGGSVRRGSATSPLLPVAHSGPPKTAYGATLECKGGRNGRSLRKPAACSHAKNTGATPPGLRPGLHWWEASPYFIVDSLQRASDEWRCLVSLWCEDAACRRQREEQNRRVSTSRSTSQRILHSCACNLPSAWNTERRQQHLGSRPLPAEKHYFSSLTTAVTQRRLTSIQFQASAYMAPLEMRCRAHDSVRLKHCTPVESHALSGDGALEARGNVDLIAPALLGPKRYDFSHSSITQMQCSIESHIPPALGSNIYKDCRIPFATSILCTNRAYTNTYKDCIHPTCIGVGCPSTQTVQLSHIQKFARSENLDKLLGEERRETCNIPKRNSFTSKVMLSMLLAATLQRHVIPRLRTRGPRFIPLLRWGLRFRSRSPESTLPPRPLSPSLFFNSALFANRRGHRSPGASRLLLGSSVYNSSGATMTGSNLPTGPPSPHFSPGHFSFLGRARFQHSSPHRPEMRGEEDARAELDDGGYVTPRGMRRPRYVPHDQLGHSALHRGVSGKHEEGLRRRNSNQHPPARPPGTASPCRARSASRMCPPVPSLVGFHALSSIHTTDTSSAVVSQSPVVRRPSPSPMSVAAPDFAQLPHSARMPVPKTADSRATEIFIMSLAITQKFLHMPRRTEGPSFQNILTHPPKLSTSPAGGRGEAVTPARSSVSYSRPPGDETESGSACREGRVEVGPLSPPFSPESEHNARASCSTRRRRDILEIEFQQGFIKVGSIHERTISGIRPVGLKVVPTEDKLDVNHVHPGVDFAIGSQFFRHALDDSKPIADLDPTTSSCASVRACRNSAHLALSTPSLPISSLQGSRFLPPHNHRTRRPASRKRQQAHRQLSKFGTNTYYRVERRLNARDGETGVPRENPPGIVQHDFHMQNPGLNPPGIEPGSPWWEARALANAPPLTSRSQSDDGYAFKGTAAPVRLVTLVCPRTSGARELNNGAAAGQGIEHPIGRIPPTVITLGYDKFTRNELTEFVKAVHAGVTIPRQTQYDEIWVAANEKQDDCDVRPTKSQLRQPRQKCAEPAFPARGLRGRCLKDEEHAEHLTVVAHAASARFAGPAAPASRATRRRLAVASPCPGPRNAGDLHILVADSNRDLFTIVRQFVGDKTHCSLRTLKVVHDKGKNFPYAKLSHKESRFVLGAAVAELLARSPPTKANRAQSPAGSTDFR